MKEASHAVTLHGLRIGTLLQRGDVARFVFSETYWGNPDRGVLGLWFEDDPRRSPKAALRLPPWFSNLLPEGQLRDWIARDQGVSVDRELQLLLRIGRDLPGAVEVIPDIDGPVDRDLLRDRAEPVSSRGYGASLWKFSLAGVGLKFSLLRDGDRLTVPGSGELGDWIVKFPTATFTKVPVNEYCMMRLAAKVGMDVPDVDLLHRDSLPPLPDVLWQGEEDYAYAVKRFDRASGGRRIHIEDFAQVRGWYAEAKYDGSFESIAALAFRGRDYASLHEFVRRLTFSLLIGNGDAHLKNWSLIYPDGKIPALSPAYDLVSTGAYYRTQKPDTIGLKFGRTRAFSRTSRASFSLLQERLRVGNEDVIDVVDATIEAFFANWRDEPANDLPEFVREWISEHSVLMRGRIGR